MTPTNIELHFPVNELSALVRVEHNHDSRPHSIHKWQRAYRLLTSRARGGGRRQYRRVDRR